jgi:Cd2+/Zn2+-exporting ATPase
MAFEQHDFRLIISGLDCPESARALEINIYKIEGVYRAQVFYSTARVSIRGWVSHEIITKKIENLGYQVKLDSFQDNDQGKTIGFFPYLIQKTETRMALLGLLLIIPGFINGEIFKHENFWSNITSMAAMLVAGFPIVRDAIHALQNRDININVLMTIAAIGAVFIGAYSEAGMVMVLFAISEALESFTSERSRRAITGLMNIIPRQALRLLNNNGQRSLDMVRVEDLNIGETILVKPGERIPMDGQVLSGFSLVNQAPITGESQLIEKSLGANVFASSINGEGTLEIKIIRSAADNTISRVIRMVEEAQENRPKAQQFIDKFARFYTPAVILIALLVALVPPLLFGQPFFNPSPNTFGWFYRGLALLVIGCPCALVISTPVTLISSLSNAARNGILIKGGIHLETLAKASAFAFDKTGTLTNGTPSVVTVRSAKCTDVKSSILQGTEDPGRELCEPCRDLVALASALEQASEHPLASAIVSRAETSQLGTRYPLAKNVSILAGRGITGWVSGQKVTIGSHKYFSQEEIEHPASHCEAASKDSASGHTPLLLSLNGGYLGTITIVDTVRPNAYEALKDLKQIGIKAIIMLTGDHIDTANKIGYQIGISNINADLLPEDKVQVVKGLKNSYGTIVMVGDGINDAPAMAAADVSIAIHGLNTTAQAMETADITIMNGDLRRLPFAIRLSRQAMRTIKVNIAFALGVKLTFMILVLSGLGTMWMAVFADMGTSLLVSFIGMRMLHSPKISEYLDF